MAIIIGFLTLILFGYRLNSEIRDDYLDRFTLQNHVDDYNYIGIGLEDIAENFR